MADKAGGQLRAQDWERLDETIAYIGTIWAEVERACTDRNLAHMTVSLQAVARRCSVLQDQCIDSTVELIRKASAAEANR